MRTVHIEQLRPQEILEEMKRCPVVFLPIGPLEWHGPHMPVGTDPLNAAAVSEKVAQRTGGVVMPTLYWGTERERTPEMLRNIGFKGDEWIVGMDFPANAMKSQYCSEQVFGIVVHESVRLLVAQGYKLIMLMNGHGAGNQIQTLKRLAAEFTANSPARVIYTICVAPDGGGDELGHATDAETSVMQFLHPESVDLGQLPEPGRKIYNVETAIVDGDTFCGQPADDYSVRCDPRLATADMGGLRFQGAVDAAVSLVQAALKEIRPSS